MVDSSDDLLDRYLAGELSHTEQRQLAQASLDDPELFDTLTAVAAAKAAILQDDAPNSQQPIDSPAAAIAPAVSHFRRTQAPARSRSFRWNGLMLAGTVAAAAALIVLVAAGLPWRRVPSSTASLSPESNRSSATPATPDTAIATARPLFLTARLDQANGASRTEFRSLNGDGRSPRGTGLVASVDDGEVTVDLGSIDGLEKGAEVDVFRGSDHRPVGRLSMTTIFRERSRGHAIASAIETGDQVELAPATRVAALLDQVEAHISAGDLNTALEFAQRAVAGAADRNVPANSRRTALDRLGTLEYHAGSLDEAARHLRMAADEFDATPVATAAERVRTLNQLGAVLVDLGQHADADRILRLAEPQATGADRARAANNLGALAALRGDRAIAESMYRAALASAGDAPDLEPDRRTIQHNLDALKASR